MTDEQKPSEEENLEEEQKPSEEEDVITFEDDEEKPEEDSSTIKHLRKSMKDSSKENRDLKKQLEELKVESKPAELPPKPKFEDSDFDNDKHDAKLNQWYKDKAVFEKEQEQVETAKQEENKTWQKVLDGHSEKATALGVSDFEDVEESVRNSFSEVQQGLILKVAKDSAKFMYVLGKFPERAKELSKIKDNINFIAEIARMESKVVTKRRPKTEPEKKVEGSGTPGNTNSTTLEKLRKEAETTGDITKVHAYRKAQRDKERING